MKKIGFVWQGITESQQTWEDGLRCAIEMLKEEYHIEFLEPEHDLSDYDAIIYWEAPCTINGPNYQKYLAVKNCPSKKILLFAGGPVNGKWVEGFDAVCIESQINKEEFGLQGIETHTAFGINEKLFQPTKTPKKYKGIHHGTFASWKRQWLVAEAFGKDALLVGKKQESDPYPYIYSQELGAIIKPETKGKDLVKLVCSADVLVQTADFWGGGQRATLEAMSCGVPVICMSDSPKNIEYVKESGAGLIAEPNKESIIKCYNDIMKEYDTFSKRGIDYVKSKWTSVHYAYNLKKVIEKICNSKS